MNSSEKRCFCLEHYKNNYNNETASYDRESSPGYIFTFFRVKCDLTATRRYILFVIFAIVMAKTALLSAIHAFCFLFIYEH